MRQLDNREKEMRKMSEDGSSKIQFKNQTQRSSQRTTFCRTPTASLTLAWLLRRQGYDGFSLWIDMKFCDWFDSVVGVAGELGGIDFNTFPPSHPSQLFFSFSKDSTFQCFSLLSFLKKIIFPYLFISHFIFLLKFVE